MRRHRPRGPKYLRAKRLKSGASAYYWAPPTWAVERGCTVQAEPLGSAYTDAVERSELLNRQFDAWRTGRKDSGFQGFTLDWLFGEYRGSRKYQRLKSRQQYELSMTLVGKYVPAQRSARTNSWPNSPGQDHAGRRAEAL